MHQPMDRLIEALSRLPGIGARSAERIALRLAGSRDDLVQELISSLREVEQQVLKCSSCGAFTVKDRDPCRFCSDRGRDDSLLCVVEDPSDVTAIERSGGMRGRYHVLGGKMSPMQNKGPWDLRLKQLIARLDAGAFTEVVLALSTNVESDATAVFISDLLKERDVKVTRLAFGLPVGSGVAYSDPATLERALRGRQGV